MPLLTVTGVEKRFHRKEALRGVDMMLESGRIYGLLGPNGSGKTTLLKIIAGLLQPDAGFIAYPNGVAKGAFAKQAISFLPDMLSFPGYMRVGDAFAFWKDMFPDYSSEKARSLCATLNLSLETTLKSMSLGMKERVALALVFSRNARVFLLDEPLGGIDPLGKSKVLDSLISAELDDACILISTHLVKDIETVLDGFFILMDGKIAFAGDCEAIREESGRTCEQVYLEVCSNAKFS